jgi:iron complex transport system substrate-binding protein
MVTVPPQAAPRRAFLAAAAGAVAAGWARPLSALAPPRLAAVDWAMAETAACLGQPPVAVAELIAFRRSTRLPEATVDLGLRGAPNLETLAQVGPDLILSSSYYAFAEPQLARIAPVFSRPLFVPEEPPLPKLIALLHDLGARIGRPGAAQTAERQAAATFAALGRRATAFADRPCLLLQIGDSRHVRVFGADSLFHAALEKIGLRNAWTEATRFAFAAPVPLERLADFPQARIVIVGEVPVQAGQGLARSALWQALPAVRAGRVLRLGEHNGFGGLPSALGFADALAAALETA